MPSGKSERPRWAPEMIRIPAGPFLMGSDPGADKHARDIEQPQQKEERHHRRDKIRVGHFPCAAMRLLGQADRLPNEDRTWRNFF